MGCEPVSRNGVGAPPPRRASIQSSSFVRSSPPRSPTFFVGEGSPTKRDDQKKIGHQLLLTSQVWRISASRSRGTGTVSPPCNSSGLSPLGTLTKGAKEPKLKVRNPRRAAPTPLVPRGSLPGFLDLTAFFCFDHLSGAQRVCRLFSATQEVRRGFLPFLFWNQWPFQWTPPVNFPRLNSPF